MRKKLSAKKLQKIDFYYDCKSFRRMTSLGLTFLHWFQRIQTQLPNFAFYDTLIEFLQKQFYLIILALFASLKPKADETAEKNKKTYFTNVSQNPILHPFSCLIITSVISLSCSADYNKSSCSQHIYA
jgi:hypothetical protein